MRAYERAKRLLAAAAIAALLLPPAAAAKRETLPATTSTRTWGVNLPKTATRFTLNLYTQDGRVPDRIVGKFYAVFDGKGVLGTLDWQGFRKLKLRYRSSVPVIVRYRITTRKGT